MPPRFGLVVFTFFFEGESPLSGLGNGAVAVRFQQLPGVVMNVDFLHRHGVMLLFFGATATPRHSQGSGLLASLGSQRQPNAAATF
jgi:hypothetical protein